MCSSKIALLSLSHHSHSHTFKYMHNRLPSPPIHLHSHGSLSVIELTCPSAGRKEHHQIFWWPSSATFNMTFGASSSKQWTLMINTPKIRHLIEFWRMTPPNISKLSLKGMCTLVIIFQVTTGEWDSTKLLSPSTITSRHCPFQTKAFSTISSTITVACDQLRQSDHTFHSTCTQAINSSDESILHV